MTTKQKKSIKIKTKTSEPMRTKFTAKVGNHSNPLGSYGRVINKHLAPFIGKMVEVKIIEIKKDGDD